MKKAFSYLHTGIYIVKNVYTLKSLRKVLTLNTNAYWVQVRVVIKIETLDTPTTTDQSF